MGETFVPLSDNDRGWIERWTAEGDRAIPMSVAYKEGDRIVVAEGPLKGMEAMITQVKRRQNLAKIEIHAGAITIRASVGLAVLPKEASRASK
jgi:transcriptional antiterminator NusG